MGKKGYFFTLDSFLAISVIVVGLLVIFSYKTYVPSSDQTTLYAQQIGGILGSNRLYEFNNPYLDELVNNGNITRMDNSLLEQLGEFYYRNESFACDYCLQLANNTIGNLSKGLIDNKYGFRVVIENVSVFESNSNEKKSEMVVSNKRLVFGAYKDIDSWGPYAAEVRVWRNIAE